MARFFCARLFSNIRKRRPGSRKKPRKTNVFRGSDF